MCSTEASAFQRVAEAINKLEADCKSGNASGLEEQVAAVWAMVREIDPELARLVSGYSRPGE